MVSILFVCMGNICRSPTAHGVFRELIRREGLDQKIYVDSAGTHAYHIGKAADKRSREAAARRGIDLSDMRARQAEPKDFDQFDYILAMDQDNYHGLMEICPGGMEEKLALFMDYAPHLKTREVPDPYYGAAGGFEQVFDLVEAAAEGLLADIRRRHL